MLTAAGTTKAGRYRKYWNSTRRHILHAIADLANPAVGGLSVTPQDVMSLKPQVSFPEDLTLSRRRVAIERAVSALQSIQRREGLNTLNSFHGWLKKRALENEKRDQTGYGLK